jgi:uncharacterized protein
MAWREWLRFDATALAPSIRIPTHVVHSETAAIPEGTRRFYNALRCEKQISWISGTQSDFYDQKPTVDSAVDLVVTHFARHLGADLVSSGP